MKSSKSKENDSQIQNVPECITFSRRGNQKVENDQNDLYEGVEEPTPMKIDDCDDDFTTEENNSDQRYFKEAKGHRGEQTPINLIKQIQNINTASLDMNRTNLTSTEVLLASKENHSYVERNEILFKEKSNHKEDNAQAISILQEMKERGEIMREQTENSSSE